MQDFYLNESGDLQIDASGDIAMTDTPWRDDVQQVYIRMMTDVGDFVLYPSMGCDLSQLYGLPQSPQTAQFGINLINAGLQREGRFGTNRIDVNAVPTSFQTVRFDTQLTVGSQQQINISLVQNLGVH